MVRKFRPKWKSSFILDAYELSREGYNESRIAEMIGISKPTFIVWKKNKELFMEAILRGRAVANVVPVKGTPKKVTGTLREFIFNRLPEELKHTWKKLNRLEETDSGYEQVEALLVDRGRAARQHLFIYAWTSSNFSTSQACRKVNISYATFTKWCENPEFLALVKEVQWHKKNFFESKLINLVQGGDTSATIFVNKTINRDRGYGESLQVNHEHSGTVTHAHVNIDELELPVNIKKLILQAVRKRKQVDSREVSS